MQMIVEGGLTSPDYKERTKIRGETLFSPIIINQKSDHAGLSTRNSPLCGSPR